MTVTQTMVRVAETAIAGSGETLYTLGLGSCVAVLLYDPAARLAGMAHVLLPGPPHRDQEVAPGKYATSAIPHLLEMMVAAGAERDRITARLVGGAAMFRALITESLLNMGARNLAAVREALTAEGIDIVGEETGKEHGRSVHFHASDGSVTVSSVLHGKVEL
ncbi:chemotaxis protein CheD [soil metagenome]